MIKVVSSIIIIVLTVLPIQDRKTIIFFGDSLTAGYGLDPDKAFPSIVQNILEKNGKNHKVVNAGLSGETSAGGLTRIDWILNQKVDVFILELGANDGLRGLPLSSTKKNLQGIIDKVREKYPDAEIVLAGMKVPPNMGPDYSKAFDQVYTELAHENDAHLIPFLLEGVAGDEALNLPDGIHPNAKGHKIVAKNVMEVLRQLL